MKLKASDLTLEEKIKLVVGKNFWEVNDLDGKLPRLVVSDGPVGLRSSFDKDGVCHDHDFVATAYPSTQVLSQTWDEKLCYEYGKILADEWIERNIDVVLGPGVNIKRNPLCGRNFEYYSEDPLVAGTLSYNVIKGIGDKHILTSLKHLCCNNTEYSRIWTSSEVDERTMREIYLKPFEIAIKANPTTIMCSYNLVNGVRMSENKALYDIAKNDFGFKGYILSDWEAVKDATTSINAGLSLIMPFEAKHLENLKEGAKSGRLDMNKLDEAVNNILNVIYKNEDDKKLRKVESDQEKRSNFARKIAEEGIVLVKNEGALPLKKNEKVLLTGDPANRYYYGGGSSNVYVGDKYINLEDSFRNIGFDATYFESVCESFGSIAHMENLKNVYHKAYEHDTLIIAVGQNHNLVFENSDRKDMSLTKDEISVIESLAKANKKMILLVYAGAPIDLAEIEIYFDAILLVGYPGEKGNEAIANILTGKVNPSGRLTETYGLELSDYPSEHTYRDESVICYSEGLNVGYRYFSSFGIPTLYPFGYGLSYSKFEYSNCQIDLKNEKVLVKFELENTSDVDGKNVVQIYVGEITKSVYRPLRELKKFDKVFLKAHEKKTLTYELDSKEFAFFSANDHKWTLNKGLYNIEINENAEEVIFSKIIEIK